MHDLKESRTNGVGKEGLRGIRHVDRCGCYASQQSPTIASSDGRTYSASKVVIVIKNPSMNYVLIVIDLLTSGLARNP
jgi:hypothetical protein